MDFTTLFTTAFLVGLSGAMMPGPMLTVTISETPRQGFWVGPKLVFGHGIIEVLLLACLAGGLTYYIQQPAVTGGIGLVGGLVLLWLGWGTYTSAKQAGVSLRLSNPQCPEGAKAVKCVNPFVSGMVLSVTNPYWSLWWATVGISYVVVALGLGGMGVTVFFAGHILADLAWYALVSFVIYSGRSFISDRLYQWVLNACAAFLLMLGCWFSYDGFRKLQGVLG